MISPLFLVKLYEVMTLLIAGRGSFCTRFVPSKTGLMIGTWYLYVFIVGGHPPAVTVVNEGFRLASLHPNMQ